MPRSGLLVCNHLSYLDIIALSALRPCIFVAKRDVRAWPLFGWLARAGGTIFVERDRRRGTTEVSRIRDAIESGCLLSCFRKAPVRMARPFFNSSRRCWKRRSIWLSDRCRRNYFTSHGSVADEVCYWRDMTLLPHLLNLFGKRQFESTLRFSSLKPPTAIAKRSLANSRREISPQAMNEKLTVHTQIIRVIYPARREDRSSHRHGLGAQRRSRVLSRQLHQSSPLKRSGRFSTSSRSCSTATSEWSQGENFLAVATSGAPLEIYPYFLDDTHCSVCELMAPLARPLRASTDSAFSCLPVIREPLKRYPVLYMHDGNNLFLEEEAFLGNTWRADEVLGVLDKMNAIEEAIVVGIHPNERIREYTQPGYEEYGQFLVGNLSRSLTRNIGRSPVHPIRR